MKFFIETLFAPEAKCYSRDFMGCLCPAAEHGAKITDVDLSKLVCPHEAIQCQRSCLGPECRHGIFVDKMSIKS